MKRLHQLTTGIFIMCLLAGTGMASGSESAKSEESSTSQATISLEEAIGIAKEAFPGKVLEAEYEREDGKDIFEVTIASADGEERELEIDAHSGKVLENEEEGEQED